MDSFRAILVDVHQYLYTAFTLPNTTVRHPIESLVQTWTSPLGCRSQPCFTRLLVHDVGTIIQVALLKHVLHYLPDPKLQVPGELTELVALAALLSDDHDG